MTKPNLLDNPNNKIMEVIEQNSDIELLTIQQVSFFLKTSKVTIHAWKRQGKLPYLKLGGKLFFQKNEVLNFINNGRQNV